MKPRTKIRIAIPLAESLLATKISTHFRSFLAKDLQTYVAARCTPEWISKQEIRFLQQQEEERRKKFRTILDTKKRSITKDLILSEETPTEPSLESAISSDMQKAADSKKAPVATQTTIQKQNE